MPPLITLLDDCDAQRAQIEDYVATYLRGDVVAAWQKFVDAADIEVPDGVLEQMFGGERDPQVVADERFWFAHEMRASDFREPGLAALRDGHPTVLVAAGAESAGQACDRTSSALAAALDAQRWIFPGDHTGFVDHSDAFAARLRDILARAVDTHPS